MIKKVGLVLCLSLVACGGGGAGPKALSTSPQPAANDAGSGAVDPPPASCHDQFSPEKLAAGEDCASAVGSACPVFTGSLDSSTKVQGCDGVTVTSIDFQSSTGIHSHYLVLVGAEPPESVYLALHYLGGTVETFANVVRLTELAKLRHTLVVVPQAPSLIGTTDLGLSGLPGIGSIWPSSSTLEPVAADVQFLTEVVADARTRYAADGLPLLVAGLSNGGSMAYNYACAAADQAQAIMSVAADFAETEGQACHPAQSIGTVIVHGTSDLINPYDGISGVTMSVPSIHQLFESFGLDVAADASVTSQPTSTAMLPVGFQYSLPDAQNRRHYLVTVQGGGHEWPGESLSYPYFGVDPQTVAAGSVADTGAPAATPSLPIALSSVNEGFFDATLQGYDLLKQAAGL